jgi:hypothetical protein
MESVATYSEILSRGLYGETAENHGHLSQYSRCLCRKLGQNPQITKQEYYPLHRHVRSVSFFNVAKFIYLFIYSVTAISE